MQCDRARHLVPQLLDGEAGPLRRWFVTRHLAQCAACSAQLEELQAMQAALRTNLPYHRASPTLAARIGAMLPREEMPGPARSPRGGRCWRSPAPGWRVRWPAWR